jgi:basic membrane protein A
LGVLEVKNLTTPAINAGEDAVITVDASNVGEAENTWSLDLIVDGVVVATETVTLKGGETKTVQFVVPGVMKDSQVEIAGLTGTIDVTPIFKIAVVSDIGGRGDLSFNDMAFKGGDDAERDFGVEMIELISMVEADYVPNLRTAALDPDVKLIVGVGFLLTHALIEVAKEFPDKNFVGIDTFTKWVDPQPNLLDVVYEEHKGSALVGALGGLLAAYYDRPHIGGVFGIEIPVLWKFEIGYKWGCDWAMSWIENNKPEMKRGIYNTPRKERVLWTYTGTFSDITKGYLAAVPMYEENAVAVYNIAGPLGLGINSAVKDIATRDKLDMGPPFWIGVDANQDWINPGFVIASMMKRVDYGVYYTTKLVMENKFRDAVEQYGNQITLGIGTTVFGIPMEGIAISTLADLDEFIQMGITAEQLTGEPVLPGPPEWIREKVKEMRDAQPDWIWNAVAELEAKIRTGEVEVPMVVTEDAIAEWRAILG